MQNLSLVERLADSDLIKTMTTSEKIMASFQVTLLGMAITFVALMILWGLIIVMGKALNTTKPIKKETKVEKTSSAPAPVPQVDQDAGESEELVAVITAAIAASLNTSTHNIVVKNIVRIPDPTPAWGQAGRTEQMNRML